MRLARQTREQFVAELVRWLPQLVATMRERLSNAIDMPASMQEQRLALDARMGFEPQRDVWERQVRQALEKALAQAQPAPAAAPAGLTAFSLLDDEVVENKIIASRLSLAAIDKSGAELNDLNVRIQFLEQTPDISPKDVLRPECLPGILIEQWRACDLSREMWSVVHETVRAALALALAQAYQNANKFLIERGVMPQINLKAMVRRTAGGPRTGSAGLGGSPDSAPGSSPDWSGASQPSAFGGGWQGDAAGNGQAASGSFAPAGQGQPGMAPVRPTDLMRVAEETRMLTGAAPMMRMRARAQGVLGKLRRLLSDRVTDFSHTQPIEPSPQLAQALAHPPSPLDTALTQLDGAATDPYRPTIAALPPAVQVQRVEQVASRLRHQAAELKQEAGTKNEKAIIEIVALMFQAILAEERIPAGIRVWFARLQIPVLRLALAEPDFFSNIDHPARQLIDRMGACAMGFEAASVSNARLEREIKRIVQVIEQYPETGRRVFQLVLDEFRKFLAQFLTEGGSAERVATLAQQVEQKEALAVQYTIELNKMLANLPVREEVREFLFHTWAEVLATASVRHGAQSRQALEFKRAAHDLLWAVSAKPNRDERARVLQSLPGLIQTLRQGMSGLGMPQDVQDRHVKTLSDAVTEAFMARSETISDETLETLSRKLNALEDVVSDDAVGDVMLDPGAIELMLGVDAGDLIVISSGGSMPSAATVAWARELELGAWFEMEQGGSLVRVQYVWRSPRGQLHIFTGGNKNYMVQTRRLAAWLQAGLLALVEDEALTVRATRDALARLDAQPAQLLS